ncbi:MAG: class I SAM-dependent methyltransferase [Planctomycetota bacterium]|nr:MAG: class I SAM-dependent methyltransferase [Planctomycetota bacterium]
MSLDEELCKDRFFSPQAAKQYSQKLVGSARDRREKRCIQRAMEYISLLPGAAILDIPCGTGRISYFLADLGYRVIAADYSPAMIEMAKRVSTSSSLIRWEVEDIFSLSYPSESFPLIVCNRLFHHFTQASTRRRALLELARVSQRYVIFSFFWSFSFSGFRFFLRRCFGCADLRDRVPISLHRMREDLEGANLRIVKIFPTRPFLSAQTYLLVEK